MRFEELLKIFDTNCSKPSGDATLLVSWGKMNDIGTFLAQCTSGDIPIYINGKFGDTHALIYSIIVPKGSLINDYMRDISKWNFCCDQHWGYGFRSSSSKPITPLPPLWHTGSMVLDGGDPILFHRFFEGHKKSSYMEANQKITQMLDIHWVEKQHSYCRFDENGDYQDVIKIGETSGFFCTLLKEDIDFLLFILDAVIIRVFDFTRASDEHNFLLKGIINENYVGNGKNKILGKVSIKESADGAFLTSVLRGFQIIEMTGSQEKMMAKARGESYKIYEYATFIARDFKHDKDEEISCNPDMLDNYFTDTGKPYQTSPAFFRPEVLLKYKQHPDKYILGLDSIQCRGAWYLKRYDVNEQGQVNVLLCDLALLPYSEQLYWKSMNEEPKGPISIRSYTQDFMGEFFDGYNPLFSLIEILDKFPSAKFGGVDTPIWEYRGEIINRKTSRLNYVLTDSSKEWTDQMIELATILNDGLNKKSLKGLGTHLGIYMKDLGSIKILEKCLEHLHIDSLKIKEIIDPLYTLQGQRSSITAHANEGVPDANLGGLYTQMLEDCDKSMRSLAKLISEGHLNLP
jgi:hypothetical protein